MGGRGFYYEYSVVLPHCHWAGCCISCLGRDLGDWFSISRPYASCMGKLNWWLDVKSCNFFKQWWRCPDCYIWLLCRANVQHPGWFGAFFHACNLEDISKCASSPAWQFLILHNWVSVPKSSVGITGATSFWHVPQQDFRCWAFASLHNISVTPVGLTSWAHFVWRCGSRFKFRVSRNTHFVKVLHCQYFLFCIQSVLVFPSLQWTNS